MKSVSRKSVTRRRATATARVRAAEATITRLRANDLPKRDALVVARVAAIAAAKRTPDVIPYCHPIPIDAVEVDFAIEPAAVTVTVSVDAVAKTGVEMEALTAATVAALTLYDMLKPIDKDMVIEEVRLVAKTGGRSEFEQPAPAGLRATVVVVSDSVDAGTREDHSGAAIRDRLSEAGIEATVTVVPDDEARITEALRGCVGDGVDLVVTTGGTGLGPRDVTAEATRRVIEREMPGIAEAARAHGRERTPYAMLSRAVAGLCGTTLVVNLPGAERGVEESLDAILPALVHAFDIIRGGGH